MSIVGCLGDHQRELTSTTGYRQPATVINKAEQLAGQQPFNPRVRQAVSAAKDIIAPAKESPAGADLAKIRAQLHARPIELMRDVVAEDLQILASLTTQVADLSSVIARGVAGASGAVLGRGE